MAVVVGPLQPSSFVNSGCPGPEISILADMVELEIDKEDVHGRKKGRRTVMNRKSNPIGKRTINR